MRQEIKVTVGQVFRAYLSARGNHEEKVKNLGLKRGSSDYGKSLSKVNKLEEFLKNCESRIKISQKIP